MYKRQNDEVIGKVARDVMPHFAQLFLAAAGAREGATGIELDRLAFCLRKRVEHETCLLYTSRCV